MAKFEIYAASPFDLVFVYSTLSLDIHSGTSARFLDTSGGLVTLKGKGLTCTADGQIIKGTVTEVVFGNDDGGVYGRITGLKLDPGFSQSNGNVYPIELISDAVSKNDHVVGSNDAESVFGGAGRDRLFGRGGDDVFYGNSESDRMTGGKGSDTFYLQEFSGNDIVTDFDANGGGNQQDYLSAFGASYTMKKQGHNLFIQFDNASAVTLSGVSKSEIDATDFM